MSERSALLRHGTISGYVRHKCRCAECRAVKAAKDKAYREAMGDELRRKKREYHAANREEIRRKARERRAADPLRAAESVRRSMAKKPEYYREMRRKKAQRYAARRAALDRSRRDEHRQREAAYRAANAVSRRMWESARRARLVNADVRRFTNADWQRVLRRHQHRCFYCGGATNLTVDHLVPLARGGRHAEGNIVPACGSCNSSKNDKLLIDWRRSCRRSDRLLTLGLNWTVSDKT